MTYCVWTRQDGTVQSVTSFASGVTPDVESVRTEAKLGNLTPILVADVPATPVEQWRVVNGIVEHDGTLVLPVKPKTFEERLKALEDKVFGEIRPQ